MDQYRGKKIKPSYQKKKLTQIWKFIQDSQCPDTFSLLFHFLLLSSLPQVGQLDSSNCEFGSI